MQSFLGNQEVWPAIDRLLQAKSKQYVAVAYLGRNGARYLNLRKGAVLCVDLSLATVKAGATNPYEVEKLMAKGVSVFRRSGLHAKVFVSGRKAIVGSANASWSSRRRLLEAAVLFDDERSVLSARKFVQQMCSEPVRAEFLEVCKKQYREPKFVPGEVLPRTSRRSKLWIVSLVEGEEIPENEQRRYDRVVSKAERKPLINGRSQLTDFHWSKKPKMASELRYGDWVIQVVRQPNGRVRVCPPGSLHDLSSYQRSSESGKMRWIFHLEIPKRGTTIPWHVFQKDLTKAIGLKSDKPRTLPIRDEQAADRLLSLWNPSGSVRKRS